MANKKILIVDDNIDLLSSLNIRLKASGYDVVFAIDGVSATSVARKDKPDLIILDIGLPAGDGFIVMARLKRIIPLAPIPIIVLTARDSLTTKERALQAGAKMFFQKPVDNDVLLAGIRETLGEQDRLPGT